MKIFDAEVHNDPYVDSNTMENLRERMGLEPKDTSEDERILRMYPWAFLNEMLAWEGIIGYTDTILEMIEMAYGIDLNEYSFSNEYKRECED